MKEKFRTTIAPLMGLDFSLPVLYRTANSTGLKAAFSKVGHDAAMYGSSNQAALYRLAQSFR